jgi:hypothetical protein
VNETQLPEPVHERLTRGRVVPTFLPVSPDTRAEGKDFQRVSPATNYIQHNPLVSDGLTGLASGLRTLAKQGLAVKYNKVPKVLGEGNLCWWWLREVSTIDPRRTTISTSLPNSERKDCRTLGHLGVNSTASLMEERKRQVLVGTR